MTAEPPHGDHEPARWHARTAQRIIERITIPGGGEHFRHRPFGHLAAKGFAIEHHECSPSVSSTPRRTQPGRPAAS